MPRFDRFESRFGRYAINGLVLYISALQLLALFLVYVLPPESKLAFIDALILKRDEVLGGEVWRLATYLLLPWRYGLLTLLSIMLVMSFGRALEENWGAFRLNLYLLGGIAGATAGTLLSGYPATSMWYYLSMLFAAAVLFPNEEIRLFFILPMKLKWIAWIAAGSMVLEVVQNMDMAVPAVLSLLNFVVAFGPSFVKGQLHAAQVTRRREKFAMARADAADFFHQCTVCGKTEKDDPTLEFRVNAEGEEICSSCRKAAAQV